MSPGDRDGAASAEPLSHPMEIPPEEMARRASALLAEMRVRRSVRHFSTRPVPREIVRDCVLCAATAPSGANTQPWHFAVVSDPTVKRRIREESEAVERRFYAGGAAPDLVERLVPLGTGPEKPFLEEAPHLVAVFARFYGEGPGGRTLRTPYPLESVGIAVGMLVGAIHHAGLVTVPYTPSPMAFLGQILGRPRGERGFAILPVGYPAEGALVPDRARRPESEVLSYF